jgi:hypothetical protein
MTFDELKEKLNELAWEEQAEFEMSERKDGGTASTMQEIEPKIQELARQITPTLLDMLEQDAGYIVWVLRLSPNVPGDSPAVRARLFLHHSDNNVRFWASEIVKNIS